MREGLQALTMDRLARHLAMSKKTIYNSYRSKGELVQALFEHVMGSVARTLESIRSEREATPPDKLRMTRDAVIARVSKLGPRLLEDLARVYPEIWRRVDARRAGLLSEHFRQILEEGRAAGCVRDDIDTDLSVLLVVRTVSGVGRPEEFMNQPWSIEQFVTAIFSLLFTGLLTDRGQRAFVDGEEGRA